MSPEEVASHATHCHGAPSGCADSGAITRMASSDQTLKLPSQSAPHGFATDLRMSPAYDAYVEPMSRPPKAA